MVIAVEQWDPTWPEVTLWVAMIAGACFCFWVFFK